jgi:hypothetical protein
MNLRLKPQGNQGHFVIVDLNEDIHENDYCLNKKGEVHEVSFILGDNGDKIIYSTTPLEISNPNSAGHPEWDFIKIKELDLYEVHKLIGSFDKWSINKMAMSYLDSRFNLSYENTTWQKLHEETFAKGFNTSQEVMQPKINEVIKLLNNICEWSSFKEHPIGQQARRCLNILAPKEWIVEFDKEGQLKLL